MKKTFNNVTVDFSSVSDVKEDATVKINIAPQSDKTLPMRRKVK
ncbi:hypothetical protein [Brachyspira aalborgi]|nr:hypothetical protein [Brachyspira aalborgi]